MAMEFSLTIKDGNPELLYKLADVLRNHEMRVDTTSVADERTGHPADNAAKLYSRPAAAGATTVNVGANGAATVEQQLDIPVPLPTAVAPAPMVIDHIPASDERDSAGMPWVEAIHSGAKSKNADGTWRRKKGVSPEMVAAVEAQYKGAAPAPVPAMPSAPPMPNGAADDDGPAPVDHMVQRGPVQTPGPVPPPPANCPSTVPLAPQPAAWPPTAAVPQPAIPAAPAPVPAMPAANGAAGPVAMSATFFDVMQRLTNLSTTGKLPFPEIAQMTVQISQRVGIQFNSFTDISEHPQAVAVAVELLQARGLW